MEGTEVDLGEGTNNGYSDSDPTYADAGKAKKKTTVAACSSAPGHAGSGGIAFLGLGLAIVSLVRRRGGRRAE